MTFVAWSVLLMLAAGAGGAALARRPGAADLVFRAGIGLAAGIGAVPAVRVLAGAPIADLTIATPMPGGPWVFGLDALSALFLLLVLVAGTASAWYGVSYLRDAGRRAASTSHVFLAALLASTVAVLSARAALPFLVAWELMALTSYATIVLEHERVEVRRAGMVYLVATHVGTLALFALFAVWGSGARDLTFASLAARGLRGASAAAVLGTALVGFGMKAGIVPLHFWLPEAHAAAPSHVSAVLSGVTIKMGIYGLMRVMLLMGGAPVWWGWLLLAAGAVSGVMGVVWALAQHDLKRLLAFHSVENIGIILLGLGVGSLGVSYGHPVVAVLGFAGAALHTVNHALFKSLLFLTAGSVARGAGTRDLDRLGGAARRMPVSAALFLVGSVAIVGLPPLNGFVSEWLVFRALLDAGLAGDALRMAVLWVAVLGLIGALALACFAKVAGVVFLGTPRDAAAAPAREAPAGMIGPPVALAAACAAIGLLPVAVSLPVVRVGALLAGTSPATVWPGGVDLPAAGATWLAVGLVAAVAVVWSFRARVARGRVAGAAGTWACGDPAPTARMQYTGSSFAAPLLIAYGPVAGVRTARSASSLAARFADPVLDGLVAPAWRGVERAALRLRPMQRGRLSGYLLYMVAALAAVLAYLIVSGWAA